MNSFSRPTPGEKGYSSSRTGRITSDTPSPDGLKISSELLECHCPDYRRPLYCDNCPSNRVGFIRHPSEVQVASFYGANVKYV